MVNLQWGYLTNVLCASVCCLKPSCTCERQRLIACPESLKATPIDRWEVTSCQSVALLAGHSVAGVLGLQKNLFVSSRARKWSTCFLAYTR